MIKTKPIGGAGLSLRPRLFLDNIGVLRITFGIKDHGDRSLIFFSKTLNISKIICTFAAILLNFKFSIMPRKPRESSGTGIYHVMLRGINRQDIFGDSEDYWTFIRMMAMVVGNPCHVYAYCLMPNHVHLLICEKGWKLGEVIKSIASCYVLYYNKKYGRIAICFRIVSKANLVMTLGIS